MSRPVVVVGDTTSHGGVVIEGSNVTDTHGRYLSRVGDKVTCPLRGHGGTTFIATSGDPTFIVDGRAIALHGDKTACGATLISSQTVTVAWAERGSRGGLETVQKQANPLPSRFAVPKDDVDFLFDIHFCVQDEMTGCPMENVPYRITLETGLEVLGTTDQEGLTEKIAANSPVFAYLEAPFYGNSSESSTDAGNQPSTCRC